MRAEISTLYLFCLFIFREKGREGERERERYINVWLLPLMLYQVEMILIQKTN